MESGLFDYGGTYAIYSIKLSVSRWRSERNSGWKLIFIGYDERPIVMYNIMDIMKSVAASLRFTDFSL